MPCRKPHPPLALHVKCQCVGVYHSFNICINCFALEKRKIFAHKNFPLYGINYYITLYLLGFFNTISMMLAYGGRSGYVSCIARPLQHNDPYYSRLGHSLPCKRTASVYRKKL